MPELLPWAGSLELPGAPSGPPRCGARQQASPGIPTLLRVVLGCRLLEGDSGLSARGGARGPTPSGVSALGERWGAILWAVAGPRGSSNRHFSMGPQTLAAIAARRGRLDRTSGGRG